MFEMNGRLWEAASLAERSIITGFLQKATEKLKSKGAGKETG